MIKFILDKAIDSIRLHHLLIQMILSLAAKKSILIYNNFFSVSPFFLFFSFFSLFFFFFPMFSGGGALHLQRGRGGHGPLVPPPLGYGPVQQARWILRIDCGPVGSCGSTVLQVFVCGSTEDRLRARP